MKASCLFYGCYILGCPVSRSKLRAQVYLILHIKLDTLVICIKAYMLSAPCTAPSSDVSAAVESAGLYGIYTPLPI